MAVSRSARNFAIEPNTMQRFEYLTVYVNASGSYQAANGSWRNIKELGEQGWELVSVVSDAAKDMVAFFKRPQQQG